MTELPLIAARGCFAPPFVGEWRVADAAAVGERLRIDWLLAGDVATDWAVSLITTTEPHTPGRPPSMDDARAAGLLPATLLDVQRDVETDEDFVFLGRCPASHAGTEMLVGIRVAVAGESLGILACRIRPPHAIADPAVVLDGLRAANWMLPAPARAPANPAHEAELRPALDPLLRALDDAGAADDGTAALGLIGSLRPYLPLAPLSRFALNIHITEGWAHKRAAFDGDDDAASRSIDVLRRTLDCFTAERHPDLYRSASLWLAQSYATRALAGDLDHAIAAYEEVIRLSDVDAAPTQVAWLHMRTGILRTHAGSGSTATDDVSAAALRRAANAAFDRAHALFELAGDPGGTIETAVARADCARLLRADDLEAATHYDEAWRLLTAGGAQEALGAQRFGEVLEHTELCLQAIDRKWFGAPAAASEQGALRGTALLLRPLGTTRRILLHRPTSADEPAPRPASLEIALNRALAPHVPITYIGGARHPHAGFTLAAATEQTNRDWRRSVEILLAGSDIVLVVPGYTEGMQWELSYLREQAMLGKCLLIMPPAGPDFGAGELWERAAQEASASGLALPPYVDEGALLRLDAGGGIARRAPFDEVWRDGALLALVEDLLGTVDEVRARYERGMRQVEQAEREGSIVFRRVGRQMPPPEPGA